MLTLHSIVAVHGLYEGALDTWTDPESGILWLRDLFPHEKSRARVLTYGYNAESLTSPGEGGNDRIFSLATTFIAELVAERQDLQAFSRPIIFICHGFGGILVKRALVHSGTSRAKMVEHRRSIYISTYAILFMGTPHAGINKDVVLLPEKDDDAGPSQFTLRLLKGSDMLQEVTDQFAPIMKRFSIYYFWEQIMTQARDSRAYIADEDSAAPLWDNVERCGIMATHSDMVKFKSPLDRGYQVVHEALQRYIKAAPGLIKVRWKEDQKILAEERQREAEALLESQPLYLLADDASPTDINEIYRVHHHSSKYFTGRKMHAKILRDKLGTFQQQSTRREHKIFVIYGLGGSGKTQFCLKYVEDNRPRYVMLGYAS